MAHVAAVPAAAVAPPPSVEMPAEVSLVWGFLIGFGFEATAMDTRRSVFRRIHNGKKQMMAVGVWVGDSFI